MAKVKRNISVSKTKKFSSETRKFESITHCYDGFKELREKNKEALRLLDSWRY